MSNDKDLIKQKNAADEFYQTSLDKLIEADYEKISYLMNLYDHDELILNNLIEFADEYEVETDMLDKEHELKDEIAKTREKLFDLQMQEDSSKDERDKLDKKIYDLHVELHNMYLGLDD